MRAGLENWIYIIKPMEARYLLRLGPIQDDNFESDARWLSTSFDQYAMEHVAIGTENREAWLLRQGDGVSWQV